VAMPDMVKPWFDKGRGAFEAIRRPSDQYCLRSGDGVRRVLKAPAEFLGTNASGTKRTTVCLRTPSDVGRASSPPGEGRAALFHF
jgi:hypothetical protein